VEMPATASLPAGYGLSISCMFSSAGLLLLTVLLSFFKGRKALFATMVPELFFNRLSVSVRSSFLNSRNLSLRSPEGSTASHLVPLRQVRWMRSHQVLFFFSIERKPSFFKTQTFRLLPVKLISSPAQVPDHENPHLDIVGNPSPSLSR